MNALDAGWAILKIDSGYWDEIYAPLYEQLGGRGMGATSHSIPALDFLPTDVAMQMLEHFQRPEMEENNESLSETLAENPGDHGFHTEQLKDLISTHGFRIPEKTLNRSQYVIPNFEFRPYSNQMQQYEGRHRTLALAEMGAPYIPSFGRGSTWDRKQTTAIDVPFEFNPVFGDGGSRYSMAAYYGRRGHYPTPPSFIFGQEIVPGMGRLVPMVDGKEATFEQMRTHAD